MDRREAMKASLLGAATMGISVKGAYAAEREVVQASGADTRGVAMTDLPLVSVFDYEAAAKKKLSFAGWEYYDEGTGDAITMKRNRSALDGLQLKPRTMVDVTNIDVSCTRSFWLLQRRTSTRTPRARWPRPGEPPRPIRR